MKRTVVAAGALALLPAVSWAVAPPPPGAGFFSVFYSFLSTRDAFGGGPDLHPDGSGGGASASLSLPLGFFANGEYAYNYQHDDNAGFGFDQQVRQGRVGGGYAFYLPLTPVSIYADGEYIHYGLKLRSDDVVEHHDEDGGGFHGGMRFTLPGLNLYAAAGYVDLSHSDGPEFEAGFRALMGPFVYLFGQYRYTHLRFDSNSDLGGSRFSFNDLRIGIGIPLGLPLVHW
jgi:hypothetical protein